jgi:hypothetical protein
LRPGALPEVNAIRAFAAKILAICSGLASTQRDELPSYEGLDQR